MSRADTIYALSSGSLPSGVAVIRLSGPAVDRVLRDLCGDVPRPRQAALRSIRRRNGELLDQALVLYMPGPASFTGEDVAELQCHGGRAVVASMLDELARADGLRAAEAGEFALRAFENGRLDLAQAEALADLIDAETDAQRQLALNGSLQAAYRHYGTWQDTLLDLRASIEADLDFSDEGDVSFDVERLHRAIDELRRSIGRSIESGAAHAIVREGFRVALVGAPNAGKSSLLNALAQRDIAIVTPIAGTTRDVIEVALDIEGHKVVLVDTAGLRQTEDPIERIGIERAQAEVRKANLVLKLVPADDVSSAPVALDGFETLDVLTKADLAPLTAAPLAVSTLTGAGLDRLISAIGNRAQHHKPAHEAPVRARHVALLRQADDHLMRASSQADPVLLAEELRLASDAIGRITGRIDPEAVLGAIFSRFCIGK